MSESHTNYARAFELLEIPQDASLPEIRNAYHHLRDLYSKGSIATFSIEHEVPEKQREKIVQEIEEAYKCLLGLFKRGGISRKQEISEVISDIDTFSGHALKLTREKLEIDLRDISIETKIQIKYLEDIEAENYKDLPPAVYTRGFVHSYASYLSLDPHRVVADYMARYHEWKEGK